MNYLIYTYVLYIIMSVGLTFWVGRTLYKNGRIFLVDSFVGNDALAGSVNHLLLVGFYLVNFGFVALYLRLEIPPQSMEGLFEVLSRRIGVVLLVLGAMHFFNLYVLHRMRKRALSLNAAPLNAPATVDCK